MTRPLRLLVYDRTCHEWGSGVGLSTAWEVGSRLASSLRRFDASRGVSSWDEALAWLATVEGGAPIREIQHWSHGKWGEVLIGGSRLDARALLLASPERPWLERIRSRFTGPDACWWFRTCETFGARAGRRFAESWGDFLGCRVAGHTYAIGLWQSGLHALEAGANVDWDPEEGLAAGTAAAPQRASWSHPLAPNTIACWTAQVPPAMVSACRVYPYKA